MNIANTNIYCNNCGKGGHNFNNCKTPINSIGIVCFRKNNEMLEYLMIRRKDTLGYIDFLRGKYSVYNKHYIMNMLKQMTGSEKEDLKTGDFENLWINIWGENHKLTSQYKAEESSSRDKFHALVNGILVKNDFYTLHNLIDESMQYTQLTETEWGFPKGRRNYQEKDFECALREFTEETGYLSSTLQNVQNIIPFEEIFIGSNYKSYKHKYYLMSMSLPDSFINVNFEKTEVSKMEWKSYGNCISSIRPYNIEKIKVITNINNALLKYTLLFI